MSERYECATADDALIAVLGPDDYINLWDEGDEPKDQRHAIVIGDPYASAYAVCGDPGELAGFVARLFARLTATGSQASWWTGGAGMDAFVAGLSDQDITSLAAALERRRSAEMSE